MGSEMCIRDRLQMAVTGLQLAILTGGLFLSLFSFIVSLAGVKFDIFSSWTQGLNEKSKYHNWDSSACLLGVVCHPAPYLPFVISGMFSDRSSIVAFLPLSSPGALAPTSSLLGPATDPRAEEKGSLADMEWCRLEKTQDVRQAWFGSQFCHFSSG